MKGARWVAAGERTGCRLELIQKFCTSATLHIYELRLCTCVCARACAQGHILIIAECILTRRPQLLSPPNSCFNSLIDPVQSGVAC